METQGAKPADMMVAGASWASTPEECANSTNFGLANGDSKTPPQEKLNCIVFNFTGMLYDREYYFAHNVTFLNSTILGAFDELNGSDVTMKAAGTISFNNTKVNALK